jgi:hypothetical protein
MIDYIYRLYSALIILGVILYNAASITWGLNIIITLAFLMLIILAMHNFLTEFIMNMISIKVSNQSSDHFSILDKFLLSTTVPVVLIFLGQVLKVVAMGDTDPDNTCLGMRDVGC